MRKGGKKGGSGADVAVVPPPKMPTTPPRVASDSSPPTNKKRQDALHAFASVIFRDQVGPTSTTLEQERMWTIRRCDAFDDDDDDDDYCIDGDC